MSTNFSPTMQTENNQYIDIFNALTNGIQIPTLVTDGEGNILSYNQRAGELFSLTTYNESLFDIFPNPGSFRVKEIFEHSLRTNQISREIANLILRSGRVNRFEVSINPYINEFSDQLYFISFNLLYLPEIDDKKLNISISESDLSKLIQDREVLNIIEDIKASYPFTFLGKGKIQNQINKIDNLFWIKDANDVYVLVNKKFASILGFKPNQLEGKSESHFLPLYLIDFYKSMESYIKETLTTLIIDGIPVKGLGRLEKYKTIEFPLSDSDNNVVAIVGFAAIDKNADLSNGTEVSDNFNFNSLPLPLAKFNEDGKLLSSTLQFRKFLNLSSTEQTEEINYTSIFNSKISSQIKKSFENEDEAIIPFELKNKDGFSESFLLSINKVFDKIDNSEHFFILIEQNRGSDSLEELLKKRGKMFDILIKSNPQPIFVYDAENLRFLEVNDAALKMYGYKRDEFLQMDLTDLYTPEDIQTLLESNNGADEGEFEGPFKQKKRDGNVIFVEISKTKFLFEGKEAHFNIVRDITTRLHHEQEFQLFKNAFETSDSIIFITDNSGFITYSNQFALQTLNMNSKELEGSSLVSLTQGEDRGKLNSNIFQANPSKPIELKVQLKAKSGKMIEVTITASPVRNFMGEIESFTIIAKREPEKIEVIREVEVIKEVEVVKEVEVIKEVEVESSHAVANLTEGGGGTINPNTLSTIFHEILTPINVILGFVQEIGDTSQQADPEQVEIMGIISQNRVKLLDTMNSIAEYALIESSLSNSIVEQINAGDFSDFIISSIKSTDDLKSKEIIKSKITNSLFFESDQAKLKSLLGLTLKIFSNVSNTSQYSISLYQYDEGNFVVSLRDDQQISDSILKLFEKIQTSNDLTIGRDFGISRFTILAVKQLIKSLSGKIEVINKMGKPFELGFLFPIIYQEVDEQVVDKHSQGYFSEVKAEVKPVVTNVVEQFEEVVKPEVKIEPEVIIPKSVVEPQEVKLEPQLKEEEAVLFTRRSREQTVESILGSSMEENYVVEKPNSSRTTGISVLADDQVDISQLNCLYIEDQVDSQILFKVQMKELKTIKFAVSFEEALPILMNNKFDFIVMDINLQGEYNGLDALKMIHQMPGFEKMPIIAVTAYVLPGDREKFIAAGFNDFISKPIFREKMIETLNKVLK